MSLGGREFKDQIYGQFARIAKALAAPKRLELLDLLCQGPRSVEALAREAALSAANASQHLQVLRAARLVEAEKKGLRVEYRLADEEVCRLFHSLRGLAEMRLAEVERVTRTYLQERGAMEAVSGEELLKRVRGGEVTVLDVRPAEEYRAGHLPGALSLPLSELEKRLAELPRRREVVAYCRGPYCVMAIEAVTLLRENGFRAHRMEQGVAEWRARGWRVETGGEAGAASPRRPRRIGSERNPGRPGPDGSRRPASPRSRRARSSRAE
jgi:rhodanese-related sulfurtransferase/DNA-binding transcriptional ArsR family regulator